ncbi:carbohydrate porin [Methylobacterium sp. J-030]|uniref:carbohydrate porin n=1 Tax=Methylobacterium sp. J-030 TaxID=2836627 RepID=UPI001FB9BFC9|nr:carbohydrate porin [Methylobacterium sp. J-030]MCJ2072931.1 carbohydrate porin [Methylobacterium sp. J-030]
MLGAAVVAQGILWAPGLHAQEAPPAGSAAVSSASAQVIRPVRKRRAQSARRPAPVAGLPLARPATATSPDLAPGGSLDTRAAAPKWGLFGNLGGVRDDLFRAGIRVDAGVDYETGTNLQGGTRQLVRGSGQFVLKGAADMNQLTGVEGGTMNFVFTQRFGRSLPIDAHLGVLQQTEEVYGRGNIPRLTTLSYDQQFGKYLDLKFGRMPVGSDFAGFACEFQNLTFCGAQPGNLVGNYWYNWPVSQYAARLRVGNLESGYIQAGVYQVNQRDLDDGFNFDPTGATGALAILEGAVFPTFGPFNYRGSYTVGGWYQTSGGPDLYYNTARLPLSVYGGLPLGHQERSGVYGVAIQELYRPNPDEPGRNLSAFLRVTFADSRTSPLDEQETLGLVYKGFWDTRPFDWIGVAIGQSHASSATARGIAAANTFYGAYQPLPGYERVLEVFYSLAVTPDVVIRPNIQFVNRPGGINRREDVVVFGVKSGITF